MSLLRQVSVTEKDASPPGTVLHPRQKPVKPFQESKKGRHLNLVSPWIAAAKTASSGGTEAMSEWRRRSNSAEREPGSCALGVKQIFRSNWESALATTPSVVCGPAYQHDLGLGLTPDPLNRNLYLTQRQVICVLCAHWSLRSTSTCYQLPSGCFTAETWTHQEGK